MASNSGNPHQGPVVYFLNGQGTTQQAGEGLQNVPNSLPKFQTPSPNLYPNSNFPQAATLPSGNLPAQYGQPPRQLVRTVVGPQGNAGVQTQTQAQTQIQTQTPAVQFVKTGTQPPAVGTSCAPCAAQAAQRPVPYVHLLNPNWTRGWNQYGLQQPHERFTDVIKYPSVGVGVGNGTSTTAAAAATVGVVKKEEPKLEATWTEATSQSNLREVRGIGAALVLIGSLTVALGIAGVVLYHSGRDANSGLAWCKDAHSSRNYLTINLLPSSPGINYVTSGAGILGLLTFIVGAMAMNLESDRGSLPNAAMYLSIFTLPVLVLMAVLSLLSFSMTFRNDGLPPTCIPLTVVTFLTFVSALVPFILLFVIYCKMQANVYNQREQRSGNQGRYNNPSYTSSSSSSENREYPLSKVSVVRVGASNGAQGVQPCTCECCPCCMPSTPCCGCGPYVTVNEGDAKKEENTASSSSPSTSEAATTTTTTATTTGQNTSGITPTVAVLPANYGVQPVMRYPYSNPQYLWGQMAPYGQYSRAVYTPYNLR